jgi:hypothetical protein
MNIEIDDDYVDNIVAQSLRECYEDMVYREGINRYSMDKDEELERIYEMRKALRLVINHYSTYEDRIPHPEEW